MLTSTKNPKIIHIRKLMNSTRLRGKERVFIVEGTRLVEEAFLAGCQPNILLYTKELADRGMDIVHKYKHLGLEATPVSNHVMQAVSDTKTPQGILAVFPIPDSSIPDQPDFILILDCLRDPGNVGTILRTAMAAGVDLIILAPGTVDPYSPKVVRSAMGAHFNISIIQSTWVDISLLFKSLNISIYLADSSKGQPYDQYEFISPLAIIIGGEASGFGVEAQNLSPNRVKIPMVDGVDSLNAACAAAVLIFEVLRQRRHINP